MGEELQRALVRAPAQWLTIAQAAEVSGLGYQEIYHRMLPQLEIRRIGTRLGAAPFGRIIRIERASLQRLMGQPVTPTAELPRWVTMKQAAAHYQISARLIRTLIAHEQLEARRIGDSRTLRVDRESLLQLGKWRRWEPQ
ncbi:hypothetical protein NGTWS1803_37880 [Mycolicibacterium cyprinidarum]|nr:hypothetical protein NGTWS1803_37880 [Mycolicibacterium sp. NGTWS1803]